MIAHELVGALEAIGWLAPGGGFPAPPAALARMSTELASDSDEAIREAASKRAHGLGSRWHQPDLG